MFLEKLELRDFGAHHHLVIENPGAIHGLLGPNASGKSTVLDALEYLLRGEISNEKRTAIDTYVRGYGEAGYPSNASVTGEWWHQGTRWRLTRQFGKTTRRSLKTIEGVQVGVEYTKADAVTQVLNDMFGVDLSLSAPAVFLKQGSLYAMLTGTDAVREELFAKLLNVSEIAKLSEVIDKVKLTKVGNIQDLTMAIDDARVAWENAEQSRRDTAATFAGIPDFSADLHKLSGLVTAKQAEDRAANAAFVVSAQLNTLRDSAERARLDAGMSAEEMSGRLEALAAEKQDIDNQIKTLAQRQAARASMQTAAQTLETTKADLAAVNSGLQARKVLAQRGKPVDVLRADFEDLTRKADIYRRYTDAKQRLEQCVPFTEPQPANHQEIEGMQQRMADLDADIRVHQKAVTALGESDCECPSCGASREHWKRTAETSKQRIAQLEQERISLYQAYAKAQQDFRGWTERKQAADAMLEVLSRDVQGLQSAASGSPDDIATRAAAAKATLDAQSNLANELTQLEIRAQSLAATVESLERQIEHYNGMLAGEDASAAELQARNTANVMQTEKLRRHLATLRAAEELVRNAEASLASASQALSAAKDAVATLSAGLSAEADAFLRDGGIDYALSELRRRQQVRDEAAGALELATRVATDAMSRLEALEQARSRNFAKQRIGNELDTLRAVFTRQGLPMAYVNYRFKRLAAVTNAFMSDFDVDMTVACDDDRSCAFKFRRTGMPEGLWLPQEKMSGGQRVRLAVAFSFAMQRLILPGLGFLTLDEPSTHLDETHVPALADMLVKVGAKLRDGSSQIWVTDHHRDLARAFSSVTTFKVAEHGIPE